MTTSTRTSPFAPPGHATTTHSYQPGVEVPLRSLQKTTAPGTSVDNIVRPIRLRQVGGAVELRDGGLAAARRDEIEKEMIREGNCRTFQRRMLTFANWHPPFVVPRATRDVWRKLACRDQLHTHSSLGKEKEGGASS